ncbi:MAG: LysR family transcriptional regulator [Alphaproteobacteria bacterium]|nr:LysR family transcriptional regulator [Alphaproteobacteria bacterium]
MTSAQLKAFYAVARFGSFTIAAARMGLSQPAVSDHIKKLEEAYGVALFTRVAKGAKLTELGTKLFAIAERQAETELEAITLLSQARKLEEGALTIGADAAVHIMPHVQRFRARHPRITIKFVSGNSADLVTKLKDYQIDFAVVAAKPTDGSVEALLLGAERIVACVAADSPFANKKSLSLGQFARETVILREQGSITRNITLDALQSAKIVPVNVIEAEGRETVQELVAQKLGIALVSKAEVSNDPRVMALNISDYNVQMSEWLICLKARLNLRLLHAFLVAVQVPPNSLAKQPIKLDSPNVQQQKRK